jgi:cytochrome c-type biogenesis protein CcmE
MTKKQQRGLFLIGSLLLMGTAVSIILMTLEDSVVFFKTPSEIKVRGGVGPYERLGGLVLKGSLTRDPATYVLSFTVSDELNHIPVHYKGVIPSLFREGQGVVVEGRFIPPTFHAEKLFVKHDESYRPPTSSEQRDSKKSDDKRREMNDSLEDVP